MSGTPYLPRPAAPFVAPVSGDIDQRLALVAQAINRKADATTVPTFTRINLISPNGQTWRVAVDNTGALQITAMPRP